MRFFQIFWSFSLESIVETSILSLLWTHHNICYVLLSIYVSFTDMLACIGFQHMMLCFETVLWCGKPLNVLLKEYFDEMAWQTCIPNILVWACCMLSTVFYFFDLLNGQTSFWCLHESCIEFYPWHSGASLMSFGSLQYKKSSKHCSCDI